MADKPAGTPAASSDSKPERITIQLPISAKPLIDRLGAEIDKAVRAAVGVGAELSAAKIVLATLEARVRELDAAAKAGE